MGTSEILRGLQRQQREHDEKAHKDIYYLSYPSRIKHLTFHVAKYAGRLAEKGTGSKDYRATVVDAFIISLSAGEVLLINFGAEVMKWDKTKEHKNLSELGLALKDTFKVEELGDWYFRQLAIVAGRMAKACESLDHMEPVPYRDILSDSIIHLCKSSLAAAAVLSIDLVQKSKERWGAIESKGIL